MKILILAGGSGERLWPLIDPPKQFRCFDSSDSLLQITLKRFLKRYQVCDIHIVTTPQHKAIAHHQASKVHPKFTSQLIIEPQPLNTAPAIAYAMTTLGDAIGGHFLIVPSDHKIYPDEGFLDSIEEAVASHEKGTHTLFGIVPTTPNAGYGYIQHASGRVTQFIEKPDAKRARKCIDQGCLWNSGITLFDTKTLKEQLPLNIPSTSIDRVILERAPNLKVIPLDVFWSDLGSWEGIYAAFPKDNIGNVVLGSVKLQNVNNCLVIVEVVGTELSDHDQDVILISKGGKKLVMPLSAQVPSHL